MDYLRAIYEQNKKLIALLTEKKKQWVKVGVIIDLTGWNKTKLKYARMTGQIEWKKDKTGIWYNVDSLLPIHIKKEQTV